MIICLNSSKRNAYAGFKSYFETEACDDGFLYRKYCSMYACFQSSFQQGMLIEHRAIFVKLLSKVNIILVCPLYT